MTLQSSPITKIREEIQKYLDGTLRVQSIFPIGKTDAGETIYGLNNKYGIRGVALVLDDRVEVIL